jgi:PKD repeat protein
MAGVTSYSFTTTAADEDNDPLTYSWDFGDGSTGTGASPSHTYASQGTYNVVVTVSDGKKEADSAAFTVTVARSLAGTWTGGIEAGFAGSTYSVEFTQNGTNLAGRMVFGGTSSGSLNITGTVGGTTYPTTVNFVSESWTVVTGVSAIDRFSGTTNGTGTSIPGTTTVTLTGGTFVSTGTPTATAATTLSR